MEGVQVDKTHSGVILEVLLAENWLHSLFKIMEKKSGTVVFCLFICFFNSFKLFLKVTKTTNSSI